MKPCWNGGVVIFERKSSDAHSIKREMSLMGKTKTTNQQDVDFLSCEALIHVSTKCGRHRLQYQCEARRNLCD